MMMKRKLVRLAAAVLLPVFAMFPVHQAAVHRELVRQKIRLEGRIQDSIEMKGALAAEKAALAAPDRITAVAEFVLNMRKAAVHDIALVRIHDPD